MQNIILKSSVVTVFDFTFYHDRIYWMSRHKEMQIVMYRIKSEALFRRHAVNTSLVM